MKTEKQQNKNEVKMPKFVHPAQFAQYMYQRHSMKKQHDKMIDDINGIEQNRLNIADFASKMSGGQIKKGALMSEFDKIDEIYALRGEEVKPVEKEMRAIVRDSKLSDEEKKEKLAPLSKQRSQIYNRYSVQALMATSMVAVDLYDKQKDIKPDKKGGLSAKGAAIIAVALAGAGVGAYFVMNQGGIGGGDGRTEMEASDYASSMVASVQINLNGNNSYVPGADTSSPEFLDMINSVEYKNALNDILATKQAEVNALRESTNAQILAEYKALDSVNAASGFTEKGAIMEFHDFKRVAKGNGDPVETWIGFLTRYKNNVEQGNPQQKYDLANNNYLDRLPQSYKDLLTSNGLTPDFKNDDEIISYCGNISVDTRGRYHFNEELPEGTTEDFYKEFYPYMQEHRSEISNIRADIVNNNANYRSYRDITNELEYVNRDIDNYCNQIDPSYAAQIREHIANIDNLQSSYETQVQQIQDSANLELTNLQASTLGLNSQSYAMSTDDVVLTATNAQPAPTDKTGILQSIIDSASDAVDAIKDGAKDVVATVIDEISRSF